MSAVDKILEKDEEDQAHEYLLGECPWYAGIHDGQWAPDPDEHCSLTWPDHQPLKSAAPRLVVKLTPRTPEASTVVKPTVPPGGPGLFHVKGMHLPPYMEHLWFHLVKRYGKHDAYRVANGIVHKWAQGVNPGGWKTKSGKGKRVHADVRAAAQRNIAEWEADRAKAHEQHHTATLDATLALTPAMSKAEARYRPEDTPGRRCGNCSMAAFLSDRGTCSLVQGAIEHDHVCDHWEEKSSKVSLAMSTGDTRWVGQQDFPGQKPRTLPPTPGDKEAREMLVAHRVDDTVRAISHASERISAALKAADSKLRGYHSTHIANHMSTALDNMHFLAEDLRLHYPAEYAELMALKECVGLSKSLSKAVRAATFSHLTETVLHELAHAKRHADEMLRPDPKLAWDFNAAHVRNHLKGAQEHIDKLSEHIIDNYPGEGRWLTLLKSLQDGHLATDEPAWRELKLAEVEAGTVSLAGAMNMGTVSTPSQKGFQAASSVTGKYSQYGLHQRPSQTVSPSPPLPPDVPVPAPREVRALIPKVPECSDVTLSNSARKFLEAAAVKLEKDDEQAALAALRSAQAAVYSAHKADLGPYMASVYQAPGSLSTTDARIIPAGQSSATAQMLQGRQRQADWRAISVGISALIERLRKRYFHGRINGVLPNLRLTQETPMSSLEKMLALAGAPVTAGQDASFPTETDTSQETRLITAPDEVAIKGFKAQKEMAALPALARLSLEAALASARDCVRRQSYMLATAFLARACAQARSASCYHLAGELEELKSCVSAGENRQHSPAEMQERAGQRQDNKQTVADTGNKTLSATLR